MARAAVTRAKRLEQRILAVPGVDAVYPSRAPLTAVGAVAAQVLGRDAGLVRLEEVDGVLHVAVSIGVTEAAAAPEAAAAVYDAIAAALTAEGTLGYDITVRVARIG